MISCGKSVFNQLEGDVWYTLALTNYEVRRMFRKMVRGWFASIIKIYYNNFEKALLINDVEATDQFKWLRERKKGQTIWLRK